MVSMKQGGQTGFTIIETVIFLAISSGLAVMLLIGVSSAIQWQQYRDTLQSYANFLRGQYSRTVSVENDRSDSQACPISGAGTKPRGMSDCVMIGRYLATSGDAGNTDGKTYETRSVYALKTDAGWKYSLGEPDSTYEINWGARTRLANQSENGAQITILMYRDVETGGLKVRTSSRRYNSKTIRQLIDGSVAPDNASDKTEICVYERGLFMGDQQSVFLGARAGSADAVSLNNASKECKR